MKLGWCPDDARIMPRSCPNHKNQFSSSFPGPTQKLKKIMFGSSSSLESAKNSASNELGLEGFYFFQFLGRPAGHHFKIIPAKKKSGIRSRDMKWIITSNLSWRIAWKISVWLVSISFKLVLPSPSYEGSKKKTLTFQASRKLSQPWFFHHRWRPFQDPDPGSGSRIRIKDPDPIMLTRG